jgi:hypothetical protein
VIDRPASFSASRTSGGALLEWASERGDLIRARIALAQGEPALRFRVELDPAEGSAASVIEYPVLGGIGALGETNVLLHSYATGFLFRDPLTLFEGEGEGTHRGVLHAPYPEGFSGAAMQLMAYYADGLGGFSFTTDDEQGAQKWFDFFKRDEYLEAAFGHGSAALGGPIAPGYDVVVRGLLDGTWWEPAGHYKDWAVQRPWCARGPVADRPDDDRRWLREEIGAATFGINAARDRSGWLKSTRDLVGVPLLHVTGPNWARTGQDYQSNLPGGIDDWFPTAFHPANLAAIREQGDRIAPFIFDLLFGRELSDHENGVAALQSIPSPTLSFDAYEFPFLCPATEFAQNLHRDRDTRLLDEGADALYYDISANNVLKQCLSDAHGHPRGGGTFLVDAYRRLYDDPPAIRGTELVNEVFLDRLDFYQARAEASPASSFEADRFRDWVKSGRVEKVPLFAFVYHEYGPVRLDGWAKLSREQGDLFYWIAARVVAWGGLLELNYEFSPLELLDGTPEPLDEHYYALPDHRYEVDTEKAAFVAELAAARIGWANPYLAYGTMLPPLPIEAGTIELDWFHYNCPPEWPAFEDRGSLEVAAVVHCAWRRGDRVGVFLVNVDDTERRVTVPFSSLRLPRETDHTAWVVDRAGRRLVGTSNADVEIELPSRRVVLLEVARPCLSLPKPLVRSFRE